MEWAHKEKIVSDKPIGVNIDKDGVRNETNKGTIHYGKNGTHIVPR